MCGGISKHGHRVPGAGIGGRGSCAVERWAVWGLRNEEGGEGLHRGGWEFVARNGELGEASAWETLRGGVPRVEGGREEPPCQGNASAVEEGSSSSVGRRGLGDTRTQHGVPSLDFVSSKHYQSTLTVQRD